jgi:hypothetical protein
MYFLILDVAYYIGHMTFGIRKSAITLLPTEQAFAKIVSLDPCPFRSGKHLLLSVFTF